MPPLDALSILKYWNDVCDYLRQIIAADQTYALSQLNKAELYVFIITLLETFYSRENPIFIHLQLAMSNLAALALPMIAKFAYDLQPKAHTRASRTTWSSIQVA